jgi:hypothetical protein
MITPGVLEALWRGARRGVSAFGGEGRQPVGSRHPCAGHGPLRVGNRHEKITTAMETQLADDCLAVLGARNGIYLISPSRATGEPQTAGDIDQLKPPPKGRHPECGPPW